MKIKFTPDWGKYGPDYWFVDRPFESPDYFAINRLPEVIDAVMKRDANLIRRDLLANGSIR